MSPWRDLLWVIPAFVAPIPSVTSSSVVSLQPILFLLQLQRRPTGYRDRRARDVDGGDHAGAGRPCVAGSLPARGAADGRGEPGRPQRPESTESCEVALVYGAAPAAPLLPLSPSFSPSLPRWRRSGCCRPPAYLRRGPPDAQHVCRVAQRSHTALRVLRVAAGAGSRSATTSARSKLQSPPAPSRWSKIFACLAGGSRVVLPTMLLVWYGMMFAAALA
ncbi:hypothetical protein GQ55_4G361300 [Panicum hallii var. hallii]|uniref:Uncharacterized protein n=1 Tax=Panicum hallii var. hallii TaxID=1504633 RepID=A0A2T7E3T3_9POAL|nr:hypothetical protein GQ55_4G361300 [Panicum hallii var. hallii]